MSNSYNVDSHTGLRSMQKVSYRKLFSLLLYFCLMATPQGLQAQVDPSIEWKEIETDTAYWLFDAKHQKMAEYYISQFERAEQDVLPYFKEKPRKTTIILVDNTDLANGSARVTPHPVISLFAVQPSPYSSIGEFRNYVHELLVHEYTHILNMEPVHGVMSPLYWVFGSIAHPNMILPRWYTEGLAVYMESKISKTGERLNSQYLQGLARALTLENKWDEYPLSDLNDGHPDWLGSSRAYLFGGMLFDSITQDQGDEVIEKMNQSYSRRIPYFLDGVLDTYMDPDGSKGWWTYDDQLKKAYNFWELGAKKQIEVVQKSSHLPGQLIKLGKGASYYSPSISPDGLWMAFTSSDNDGAGNVHLALRHPKRGFRGYKPKMILEDVKAQNIAWHPAATGFVYEKLQRHKLYNRFYDLYFYDLRTKKSKRLTTGGRAYGACFSALGGKLFYLANIPGRKKIMAMDWFTQKTTKVYETNYGIDIKYLTCESDQKLLFVEHIAGKKAHVVRFNSKTQNKSIVFDEKEVRFLRKTHLGMLISSPDSGIDNLYLIKKGKVQAITNSLTRVLKADLDPLDDGLYFSQTTASGPKLFYLKGAQWESLPDTPPKVESIFKPEGRRSLAQATTEEESSTTDNANETTSTKSYESDDFSPWRYLYPNHWIPFLFFVDRGTIYQAQTSAGDPLGINQISLVGQWDTLTKKAGASLSYLNNSTPVTMGFAVSDFYSFFYADESILHLSNASALFGGRLGFLDHTRWLFRWNYSSLERLSSIFIRQGPQAELSYSDTKAKRSDISTSSGWNTSLGHKNYLADLGTVSYGETYAHLGTFWSSFTPKRHVFYLGINGSYAPQLNNTFFATTTLAGPFFNPQLINATYLQRGYATGNFVAQNILNTNAEYRFPLWDMYSGWTAPPTFFRNLQAAFVFDASTLDGRYRNSVTRTSQFTEFGRWFTGYGLELETNVQAGFHVPLTFTLGLYYGEDQTAFGGFTTFFNVRL